MQRGKLLSFFKDLSEETRFRILQFLLSRGEMCVCEIARELGLSQPLTSHHLYHLKVTGLVTDRREGTRVYYAPNHERLNLFCIQFEKEFQVQLRGRKLSAKGG